MRHSKDSTDLPLELCCWQKACLQMVSEDRDSAGVPLPKRDIHKSLPNLDMSVTVRPVIWLLGPPF